MRRRIQTIPPIMSPSETAKTVTISEVSLYQTIFIIRQFNVGGKLSLQLYCVTVTGVTVSGMVCMRFGVSPSVRSFYASIVLQKLATFHGVSIALRVVSHAVPAVAHAQERRRRQCARNRKRVFGFRVKTETAAAAAELVNECRRRRRKKQIVTSNCGVGTDLVLLIEGSKLTVKSRFDLRCIQCQLN